MSEEQTDAFKKDCECKKDGECGTGKKWTIMVYMAGDNELSEDMATALKAMKAFAHDPHINVVALYDSNYPPVPVTFYDFTEMPPVDPAMPGSKKGVPELRRFAKPEVLRKILSLPPVPLPTPSAPEPYEFDINKEFVPIKKFVPWVLQEPKYKACRYALILCGHSDGVIGRTIMRDDNPPEVLNLATLTGVLDYCREYLPMDTHPDRKFDLLGFDGCLMGMLEAAYELKDTANYMVASEGNIPDSGWDYDDALLAFKPSPGSSESPCPCKVACNLARTYAESNGDYTVGGRAINISAFRLGQAEPFAKAIDEIAGFLLSYLAFDKSTADAPTQAVFRGILVDLISKSHYFSQTFMHNQAVDIMDFLFNLFDNWRLLNSQLGIFLTSQIEFTGEIKLAGIVHSAYAEMATKYTALRGCYDSLVIEKFSVGAEYQFSKGVSLFFPWSQMALNLLSYQYRLLKFDRDMRNWRCFFKNVVELTMRTPETKSFTKIVKENESTKSLSDVDKRNIIDFEKQREFHGKEYVGKEYVGREYVGRGSEFYNYFEQMRNFSHLKLDETVYGVDFYDHGTEPESI